MATTIPTITAPPSVPSRDDPVNFDSRADAFLGWMEHPFADEINAAIAGMNTLGGEMVALRDETEVIKNQTEAIQNNVLALVNVTIWNNTTTYSVGDNVSASNGLTYRALLENTSDNPVTSVTGNWVAISTLPPTISARSSDFTLSATDLSGNFTITNSGATGEITATWQTLSQNQRVKIYVAENQYFRIKMNGLNVIDFGSGTTATGGYIRSNVAGDWVDLQCDGTKVFVFDFSGVWSFDQ